MLPVLPFPPRSADSHTGFLLFGHSCALASLATFEHTLPSAWTLFFADSPHGPVCLPLLHTAHIIFSFREAFPDLL